MSKSNTAQYAVYKGEEFLDLGTIDELSKRFNMTKKHLWWIASATRFKNQKHRSSIELYKIEEDEDE